MYDDEDYHSELMELTDDNFEARVVELRAERAAKRIEDAEWAAGAPERQRLHEERMANDPDYRWRHEMNQMILQSMAKQLNFILPTIYERNEIVEDWRKENTITIRKPNRYITGGNND